MKVIMLGQHFIFIVCIIVSTHGNVIPKKQSIVTRPSMYDVSIMTYLDPSNMSSLVRQHVKIENKTRHIYISPLAVFDVNQTRLLPNPTTNRTTLTIPLILYTDEQIKFIRENNTRKCNNPKINCEYHEVSTQTMRVIYKHESHYQSLSKSYHQYINSIWLSYNSLLNQRLLYVNIDCTSNVTCLKLDQVLHQSNKPLGLHLEYTIQEAEQQQQVTISKKDLLKTKFFSSKYILENNIEEFLQAILRIANIRNNGKYVVSQIDLFLLKETLRKQLLGKNLIFTSDNDEKQWNSIYWTKDEKNRPDRIFRMMRKRKSSIPPPPINSNNENEIDQFVKQTYCEKSIALYLKYQHLFELHNTNNTKEKSLKLKPILAYELNQVNTTGTSLIHQPMHMIKRDDIHLIQIRSIVPSKETSSRINTIENDDGIFEKLVALIERLKKKWMDFFKNSDTVTTTTSKPVENKETTTEIETLTTERNEITSSNSDQSTETTQILNFGTTDFTEEHKSPEAYTVEASQTTESSLEQLTGTTEIIWTDYAVETTVADHTLAAETIGSSSEQSTETTETTVNSSEQSTETTETTVNSSEQSTETTETTVNSSEQSTETTETTVNSSEQSTETTETTVNSSEQSTETTETTVNSSEQSTETTETTVNSSEQSTETTETTVNSSEQSTETTETTVNSSEQSTETTETTVNSSEQSTETTETTVNSSEQSTESTEIVSTEDHSDETVIADDDLETETTGNSSEESTELAKIPFMEDNSDELIVPDDDWVVKTIDDSS